MVFPQRTRTSNGDNITLESTSQVPMEKAKQKHENETFSVEQDEVESTSISSTILQGSTTNCRRNLLAADIEGIKLDMVIMQMQIESNNVSQNRVLNKLGERDEISCLKQDLHKERERSKELEKDMIILVEGRNREVEELKFQKFQKLTKFANLFTGIKSAWYLSQRPGLKLLFLTAW